MVRLSPAIYKKAIVIHVPKENKDHPKKRGILSDISYHPPLQNTRDSHQRKMPIPT